MQVKCLLQALSTDQLPVNYLSFLSLCFKEFRMTVTWLSEKMKLASIYRGQWNVICGAQRRSWKCVINVQGNK